MLLALLTMVSFYSSRVEAKRIYTGNNKIDAACEIILQRCTNPKMTSKQKLKAVYEYLVKNMKYSHSDGHTRIHVKKAHVKAVKKQKVVLAYYKQLKYSKKFRSRYRNLITLQGTCYDMSAVFCIMANHLGYRAGLCSGRYVRGNGSSCEHWWNYVVISGQKKYFDVQAANACWKGHHKMNVSYYCQSSGSHAWSRHHD